MRLLYPSLLPPAIMDAVRQCIPLTYAPELAVAFTVFKFICTSVAQVQLSKSQLEALAHSIAQLLQALDGGYRARRLLKDVSSAALADLSRFVRSHLRESEFNPRPCRLLDDISHFVQREASSSLLKLLFTKNQRIARIDGYYQRIGTLIQSFQVWYNIL
jgi:hypothetical protein